MTVNLKQTSGDAIYLGLGGRRVEDGEVVHVEGDVSDDSPADAYLIGDRLWPKATWTNIGGKPVEPDVTEEN